MASSRSRVLQFLFSTIVLSIFLSPANALYFYLDGTTQKCVYEELPKGTLVVGRTRFDPYEFWPGDR